MRSIADTLPNVSLYVMTVLALCTPEKASALVYLVLFGHGNAGYLEVFFYF